MTNLNQSFAQYFIYFLYFVLLIYFSFIAALFQLMKIIFNSLNDTFKAKFCSFERIEETWRLWQKFLDDYSQFEEWLMLSEKTAALPNSSGVLYTVAKEELKKFEVRFLQTE